MRHFAMRAEHQERAAQHVDAIVLQPSMLLIKGLCVASACSGKTHRARGQPKS